MSGLAREPIEAIERLELSFGMNLELWTGFSL